MAVETDVIVIGAGVSGTSCALQLARKGHRTLLLDRQHFPRHKTCGEFLSPETREMLEYLGIRPDKLAMGTSNMDHARIIMPQGGEITAPLPGQAYGVSRYELDRLLQQHAMNAGTDIVTGTTVTNIRQLADRRYEVDAKQGDERVRYAAKAVIGAHGTQKPRGVSSPDVEGDITVFVGIKSHYQGVTLHPRVELYFCEGGYVGISPIENGRVNVAALLTLKSVQGSGKSVPEILRSASRTNKGLAYRLAEGEPVPGTQVSIAPIRLSDLPEPWSQYPHIGDAMMMLPPLCGDGMSVALRSSRLCADWTGKYLDGDIQFNEWKHQYSLEANAAFTQLLRRARRIQSLAFARTNRFYPAIARMIPGLAAYLVKATRLSESGIGTR